MLLFYVRRALRSLRRTPGLSSVMVIDMALGLAIWMLAYAAVSSHTRDPLTDSSALYHVDWGTTPSVETEQLERYQRVLANAPHMLLSYADAKRLAEHPAVSRSARTFTSRLAVGPRGRAVESAVRFCTRDLFALFELRFRYGGPWDAAAERSLAPAVVLDHDTNERLFDGKNSVGRTLEIDGQAFRVAGVLESMAKRVRGFDFTFSPDPAIYVPFEQFVPLGAQPDYLASRTLHGGSVADLLRSNEAFVQLWVELKGSAARDEYAAFLRNAAAAADPPRVPRRAMLEPLAAWLERNVPIANGFYMFEACAFLALLACSVNLSRLLIVKFQARAPELAIQRALGATRASVFGQHMLEAVLLVLFAIALGLLIAYVSLFGINEIVPDRPAEFALSFTGVAIGAGVGLGLGLLAGVPPAVRMCRAAPAEYLRAR